MKVVFLALVAAVVVLLALLQLNAAAVAAAHRRTFSPLPVLAAPCAADVRMADASLQPEVPASLPAAPCGSTPEKPPAGEPPPWMKR